MQNGVGKPNTSGTSKNQKYTFTKGKHVSVIISVSRRYAPQYYRTYNIMHKFMF